MLTVGDVRKFLADPEINDDAVVCLCEEGYSYAPMLEILFDAPKKKKDKNEKGNVLFRLDAVSEIYNKLSGWY